MAPRDFLQHILCNTVWGSGGCILKRETQKSLLIGSDCSTQCNSILQKFPNSRRDLATSGSSVQGLHLTIAAHDEKTHLGGGGRILGYAYGRHELDVTDGFGKTTKLSLSCHSSIWLQVKRGWCYLGIQCGFQMTWCPAVLKWNQGCQVILIIGCFFLIHLSGFFIKPWRTQIETVEWYTLVLTNSLVFFPVCRSASSWHICPIMGMTGWGSILLKA